MFIYTTISLILVSTYYAVGHVLSEMYYNSQTTSLTGWKIYLALILFAAYTLCISVLELKFLYTFLLTPWIGLLIAAFIRFHVTNNKRKLNPKRFLFVTMPISHFGEKTRWVLDLLQCPYEESNVAGLLSISLRGRSVPWLVDRVTGSVVNNSDDIAFYAAQMALSRVQTSDNAESRHKLIEDMFHRTKETIEMETDLNKVGHCLQGFFYFYLLKPSYPPEHALNAWGKNDKHITLLEKILLSNAFPLLRMMLVKAFQLNSLEKHSANLEFIRKVMDKADRLLDTHQGPYLYGMRMSYIDIFFASIMAPVMADRLIFNTKKLPTSKGLYTNGRFESFTTLSASMIDSYPQKLKDLELELSERPCGKHVAFMYETHRHNSCLM